MTIDRADKEFMDEIAQSRAIAEQGDPVIFGPLLQQLDAAESEQDVVVAMLAITIANLDELQKEYADFAKGESK